MDAQTSGSGTGNGGDKKALRAITAHQRMGEGKKNSQNQFHNFKQRDTDYDALMLKQVKEWVGGRKTPYIRNRPGRALQTGRRTGDGTE